MVGAGRWFANSITETHSVNANNIFQIFLNAKLRAAHFLFSNYRPGAVPKEMFNVDSLNDLGVKNQFILYCFLKFILHMGPEGSID